MYLTNAAPDGPASLLPLGLNLSYPDAQLATTVRRVAAILGPWEDSGESDLSAARRIVRVILEEMLTHGPTELEQLDSQLSRLFPNLD